MYQRSNQGFTLIEILVVLLIVAIMSALVIPNLSVLTQHTDFNTEANRLLVLLSMAREEAMSQANELGFKPTQGGYAFYIYDEFNQAWVTYQTSPLKPRTLADGIELELTLRGERLWLDTASDGGSEHTVPPLILFSNGEVEPFRLTIFRDRDQTKTMSSDGYNDITWNADG